MRYFATKISENMHRTPEGYLLVLGVRIGRVGEMEYGKGETPIEPGKNGIAVISRTAEELFRPETIASFQGKPFTIKHPQDFVNPENWRVLAKGVMQNVRQGDGETKDDLLCDLLITDQGAISLVEDGLRGLSCGYEADYEQTGDGRGVQKNIIGNHLALVEEGRAGDKYRINDSKGVFKVSKKFLDSLKTAMANLTKTVDSAVAEQEGAPAEDELTTYDELMKQVKDLEAKITAAKDKKAKDADKPEEKKEEAKSEDEGGVEERLGKLEAGLAKILELLSATGDEDKDEEETDDDLEPDAVTDEEEEVEDEDAPQLTGDEKSRVEILAPGTKTYTKDFKADALKAAYKTADGKKAIDAITNNKPKFDGDVDLLFNSTSELLKGERTGKIAKSKKQTMDNGFQSAIFDQENSMTAEKVNEMNRKHYSN